MSSHKVYQKKRLTLPARWNISTFNLIMIGGLIHLVKLHLESIHRYSHFCSMYFMNVKDMLDPRAILSLLRRFRAV